MRVCPSIGQSVGLPFFYCGNLVKMATCKIPQQATTTCVTSTATTSVQPAVTTSVTSDVPPPPTYSQVVAGTNYFCKLQVDGGDGHIHARIFQGLPHTGGAFEVHGVQKEHSADSELAYF